MFLFRYCVLVLNSAQRRGSSSGAPTARTRRVRVPALAVSTVRTLMRQTTTSLVPRRARSAIFWARVSS